MRRIKHVTVIGSGVMGSRIACHFANVGVEVLLLDRAPDALTEKEEKVGLNLSDKAVKNRIVNDSLKQALKSNPSPIYSKKFASRIQTGNLDDDLNKVSDTDWIIEVIIEDLGIKQALFEKLDGLRKPGTLISSNTSGIPINMMIQGRSDDFQKHFCGTHFFNPPRYLALLEIIPTQKTDSSVIDFLMDYGKRYLGKQTVLCQDTPAFIANRVGIFSIMALFHLVDELELTVDEVDRLTGPLIGRPKSATFRTCDVVGLDTLVRVAKGLEQHLPNDEQRAIFKLPDYVEKMVENRWFGSKTKQGFFKKIKGENGKSEILSLDLKTLEYGPRQKAKFATLEAAKPVENMAERFKVLVSGKDKAGEFYRRSFMALFAYVSYRIPEITDALYKIDDAIRAGFGWKYGPFETWDMLGLEDTLKAMEASGHAPAPWIAEMVASGKTSFYGVEDGKRTYYDKASGEYRLIPGQEKTISLDVIRDQNTVWKNASTTLTDLGDGILNLEFHTKMNTIGGDVLAGINYAIDLAEKEYQGLVISNTGDNFSAGANVGLIFMMAIEQEYDELDFAIRTFQNTIMRVRYSSIPVVVAPHNLCLGGGCEMSMHADKVVAHSELYMGLVEFGVGVIPGGGGTKEFALRCSDGFKDGDIRINTFRDRFLTIGQAKVSTSAYEAFDLGYLRKGIDEVVVSRELQLSTAKRAALEMAERGYTQPIPRTDIKVLGQEGLGIVYVGANSMKSGHYISEHDQLISEKLGWVLCGGDLSEITEVSEQYLLDMERRAFLELCGTRKTLERLQSIIKTGKVLRN
ncbi:3-hydroxyacyl-CoA dehydrogenase [bacterium SCSIO 12741]|nr:3-hydroxyacyl-CoA dehydrogenase [bacterium SCSIO 12741]